MGQRISRNHGKSVVDLVVVMGLAVALLTVTLGAMAAADSAHARDLCMKNLHQIGLAMIMYGNGEKNGGFPRVYYDVTKSDKPNCFTASNVKDVFGDHGPVNDVTAAMFLLIRNEQLLPDTFVCPATDQSAMKFADGKTALDYSNFTDGKCLSYSMNNPYADTNAISSGYKWNTTLDQHFALMADRNPGDPALLKLTATSAPAELQKGNSLNHTQAGQNVLYGDGHVEFKDTPFCGKDQDNIYTYGDSKDSGGKGIVGAPDDFGDTVCLPTAKDNGGGT